MQAAELLNAFRQEKINLDCSFDTEKMQHKFGSNDENEKIV